MRWRGDSLFVVQNLILKDFRTRYRNMSLGVFWSLLSPLVMMTVLWFVFTKIYPNNRIPHFGVFVLCGLVPYNFFTIAWVHGTTSIVENGSLIKRVAVPRELLPISAVLATMVNMTAQVLLLLICVLIAGLGINWNWFWLLFIWLMEVFFICGLSLVSSALNVYIRDMRYVVESVNVILFWLVPIFYSFDMIAPEYREVYLFNPVAALVMASRTILIEQASPATTLLVKLALSSMFMLVAGFLFFRRTQTKFYDYL